MTLESTEGWLNFRFFCDSWDLDKEQGEVNEMAEYDAIWEFRDLFYAIGIQIPCITVVICYILDSVLKL